MIASDWILNSSLLLLAPRIDASLKLDDFDASLASAWVDEIGSTSLTTSLSRLED
jgi:hypothetical protein